jgi:hypothetical protein
MNAQPLIHINSLVNSDFIPDDAIREALLGTSPSQGLLLDAIGYILLFFEFSAGEARS